MRLNKRTRVSLAAVLLAALTPSLHGHIVLGTIPDRPDATARTLSEPRLRPKAVFEENLGQADPASAFVGRFAGLSAVFGRHSFTVEPRAGAPVTVAFRNASATSRLVREAPSPSRVGYFRGRASSWRGADYRFGRLRYEGLYPGVDLVVYEVDGVLNYDFVVAPGGDASAITLDFPGARSVSISPGGDLVVDTASGAFRQTRPRIYQPGGTGTAAVAGEFRARGPVSVGFRIAGFDPGRPLVIDPAVQYSSYLGGSDDDFLNDIAVGPDGSAYLLGSTNSGDFPGTAEPGDDRNGVTDLFVARLSPDGSQLLYGVYIGGESEDVGTSIGVGPDGSAYVTGRTTSLQFPVSEGAFDPTNGRMQVCTGTDCIDSFVVRISPDGDTLTYSTYLGGEHDDYANALAVDSEGNALIVGRTESFGFPRVASFNPDKQAGSQGFITKMNPAGTAVMYSSYIGGNGGDNAFGVAVDASGAAYVVGTTTSEDFQTLNPFQAANAGGTNTNGNLDAFAIKVTPGGGLAYGTYLGGTHLDYGRGIAVDGEGRAVVAGFTTSPDFPLANPLDATLGGPSDAFVARISADGAVLEFSTLLGGGQDEEARSVDVNADGDIAVVGLTRSADFPVVDAFQPSCAGCASPTFQSDAFVTVISDSFAALEFSTFLGGRSEDIAQGAAFDETGTLIVAGITYSPNFPTTEGAFSAACPCPIGDTLSGFVTSFTFDSTPPPDPPSVTSVQALKKPFRLVITGDNFREGAQVFIGEDSQSWQPALPRSETVIELGGGKTLKARFPKRQSIQIRVVNSDGTEATGSFTR